MAFKQVSRVDVAYDDKVYGNLIDPYEWNNNFSVIEGNSITNAENINENFATIEGTEGAAHIGVGDLMGGTAANSTVAAQLISIVSRLINTYSIEQINSMLNGIKNDVVTGVGFNPEDGCFTITKGDGTQSVLDTNIEKIPVSVGLEQTEEGNVFLVITNFDGSFSRANVTNLLNVYSKLDSDTIALTIDGYVISAFLKNASVTAAHLASDVVTMLEEKVLSAEIFSVNANASAQAAANSEKNASDYANLSKSYAIGEGGAREGESTDNSKYYCEQAQIAKSSAEGFASNAEASRATAENFANTAGTEANRAKAEADRAEAIAGGDFVTNADFQAHTNDKNNPHNVTASDVGALPLTGGTLTGTLSIRPGIEIYTGQNTRGLRIQKTSPDGTTVFNRDFQIAQLNSGKPYTIDSLKDADGKTIAALSLQYPDANGCQFNLIDVNGGFNNVALMQNVLPLAGGTMTGILTAKAGIVVGEGIRSDTAFTDQCGSPSYPWLRSVAERHTCYSKTSGATTVAYIGSQIDGTTEVVGDGRVQLGNAIAKGNNGNATGRIYLYGDGNYAVGILPNTASESMTGNIHVYLPNKTCTLAATSDIPEMSEKHFEFSYGSGSTITGMPYVDIIPDKESSIMSYCLHSELLTKLPKSIFFRYDYTYTGNKHYYNNNRFMECKVNGTSFYGNIIFPHETDSVSTFANNQLAIYHNGTKFAILLTKYTGASGTLSSLAMGSLSSMYSLKFTVIFVY